MIRFVKYQNKSEGRPASGKWYARAVIDENVSLSGLAKHMAAHNTPFSQGAIHGVLKDMVACIKELILEGKAVKIDDLCIFRAALSCKGAETLKDFSVAGNVTAVRLQSRATGELMRSRLALEASLREADEYQRAKENGVAETAAEEGAESVVTGE